MTSNGRQLEINSLFVSGTCRLRLVFMFIILKYFFRLPFSISRDLSFGTLERITAMRSTTTHLALFWQLVALETFHPARFRCGTLRSEKRSLVWRFRTQLTLSGLPMASTFWLRRLLPEVSFKISTLKTSLVRVDNNFRIWNYLGEEMFEDLMQEASGDGSEKKMIELAQVMD